MPSVKYLIGDYAHPLAMVVSGGKSSCFEGWYLPCVKEAYEMKLFSPPLPYSPFIAPFFEDHPPCHLSPKYAWLVWGDLWLCVYTQIKRTRMRINPNMDSAIISPQVLSNMILDSLKVEHISHKQLISSKLSFNPTQLWALVKSTPVFSSFWAGHTGRRWRGEEEQGGLPLRPYALSLLGRSY